MRKHSLEPFISNTDVSDDDRCQLQQLQQSLGLRKEIIGEIEAQVIQAYDQKLQQYEQAFTWASQRQYPLSDEDREFLEYRRQKLSLSKEITDKIEAKVTEIYKPTLPEPEEPVCGGSEQGSLPNNGTCPVLPTATGSFNPIPPVVAPIKKPVTKLGGEHKEKVRRLRLKATVVAALVSVGAIAYYGYTQWQAYFAKAALERTETLKERKEYEECVNQAKAVPQQSLFYTDAQDVLNQCQRLAQDEKWLAQAKELEKKNSFKDAIAAANKIQSNSSFHQEAQPLISQWSLDLLKQAEGRYKESYTSKDLENAIDITKAIPKTSSVAKDAEEAIGKWRTEWNNNENSLKEAQNALKEGNWQKAIDKANKVRLLGQKVEENTLYWQNKMKPLLKKADELIAASNKPRPVPIPRITQFQPIQPRRRPQPVVARRRSQPVVARRRPQPVVARPRVQPVVARPRVQPLVARPRVQPRQSRWNPQKR